MTQAPTYFKLIHGLNMNMTGLLSGLPHLMRMAFAFVFSLFGDYLLTKELMTRTNVRKLAGTFCLIVNGLFVIGLAYSGCNSAAAISLLVAATAMHGAVSTGPLASLIDISPNFSGITLGLTGMFAVLPGFISPLIVGSLTLNNVSVCLNLIYNYLIMIDFINSIPQHTANRRTVEICVPDNSWNVTGVWIYLSDFLRIEFGRLEYAVRF